LFQQGLPLARGVDSTLRVDLEMFSRGGIAVLDSIEPTLISMSDCSTRRLS